MNVEYYSLFTPAEISYALDEFVVGQYKAKEIVALALRNSWRRMLLEQELMEETSPYSIILIGSTGCGKTEIAGRLTMLTQAPFLR